MACAVVRQHLHQTRFAELRIGMVVVVDVRLFLWIPILAKIARLVLEVRRHARHRCRAAARIESRPRRERKAPRVSRVLRRQREELCRRIGRKLLQLLPVHDARRHVEERQAVVRRHRLGVNLGAVVLDAVRHLMTEHGRDLRFMPENAHEAAVHRDVVRRIARRVEERAVIHMPRKRQCVGGQHEDIRLRQPRHDAVDDRHVARIAVRAIRLLVLPETLLLVVRIVSDVEHHRKPRLVRDES